MIPSKYFAALVEKWSSYYCSWGNDAAKVRTEAFHECARELAELLKEDME